MKLEISGQDPVLGISFGELAGRSRAMHKTQGFGNFSGGGRGETRTENFQLLAGDSATNDILDGVDTTWNRVPGGGAIGKMTGEIISQFKPADPAASVPELLKLRAALRDLDSHDPVVVEKRILLDRILQNCLGLSAETTISDAEAVPGEALKLKLSATVKSSAPVKWVAVRFPTIMRDVKINIELPANQTQSRDSVETLPLGTPLSQPYWLQQEGAPGMFHVKSPGLIGTPENPPVLPEEQIFEVSGQTLVVPDSPVQAKKNSDEMSESLKVIPPVSLRFGSEVGIFNPGAQRAVDVMVIAYRANTVGNLRLEIPEGWKVSPAKQPFHITTVGETQHFQFEVTGPARPASAKIIADATIGGAHFSSDRVEIKYRHIPMQLLQPLATMKAVDLNLATRGHKIGYVPGAGDSVDEALREMGYEVTTLSDEDLTREKLRDFDAVVIGVRAFNVRTNFAEHLPGLFSYVENGGTVVAQYNRPDNSRALKMAPFDLRISGDRVTDENAAITFLAPEHPVLNTPNKITVADFAGWVQERGIYFPSEWDQHFTPILACSDPGEAPLKGSLLVAQYGKGYFIYTGLVFFRELPAGIPARTASLPTSFRWANETFAGRST